VPCAQGLTDSGLYRTPSLHLTLQIGHRFYTLSVLPYSRLDRSHSVDARSRHYTLTVVPVQLRTNRHVVLPSPGSQLSCCLCYTEDTMLPSHTHCAPGLTGGLYTLVRSILKGISVRVGSIALILCRCSQLIDPSTRPASWLSPLSLERVRSSNATRPSHRM
jgi:hypothetical protein